MKRLSTKILAKIEEDDRKRRQRWADEIETFEAQFPHVVIIDVAPKINDPLAVRGHIARVEAWLSDNIGERGLDHGLQFRPGGAGFAFGFIDPADALAFEMAFR